MEPTEEQIKQFWEKCGAKKKISGNIDDWILDTCELSWKEYKKRKGTVIYFPIDLNNLFKYAVPKLMEYYKSQSIIGYLQTSNWLMESWVSDWIDSNNSYDPAQSLFWAIYKALGGK